MRFLFSKAAESVRETEIVRITQMASGIEDMIPFTVGLPAPETIPERELKKIVEEIISSDDISYLQYSPPKGSIEGTIKEFLEMDNIMVEEENIAITTGALQGGFLASRALISPDDYLISELPAYSINLQNFMMHTKNIVGIDMDEEGMITEELEYKLKELKSHNIKPKFIYTIPDFQNPTGVTMSLERRKALIEIAEEFDTIILEDTPYRYMRYEGNVLPSLRELGSDWVIHINSFSKTVATGLRVGYIVAHPELIKQFVAIKTPTDYCTPPLNQMIIERFLKKGLWPGQMEKLRDIHKKRRDVFIESLREYMPEVEGLEWNKPLGGTFLWLSLPHSVDMGGLLNASIRNKVLFVPGDDFYPDGMDVPPAMRLNFPYHPEDVIREGVRRLATAIKSVL
jgi:2-aminoadipate transaminase